MFAYAYATLDNEALKLTGFSSGDKLFAFFRGFYGLKGLPYFLTQQMSMLLKDFIRQGSSLVYIVVILLMSNSKPPMLQLISELYKNAKKNPIQLLKNLCSSFLL